MIIMLWKEEERVVGQKTEVISIAEYSLLGTQ